MAFKSVLVTGVSCVGKSHFISELFKDEIILKTFFGSWYIHVARDKVHKGQVPKEGAVFLHFCIGDRFFYKVVGNKMLDALNIKGAIVLVLEKDLVIRRIAKKIVRREAGKAIHGDSAAERAREKYKRLPVQEYVQRYKTGFAFFEKAEIPYFIVHTLEDNYQIIPDKRAALAIVGRQAGREKL